MAATELKDETGSVIRTPRLLLSPLSPRYASALFELLNDWDVVRMLSEVPWPLRLDDVAAFLAEEHPATEDFVLVGASGPLGVVSVKKPGSGTPPRTMPRLGYWIGQRYWRQGYGSEAIGALVDHAFRTYSDERVGAGVFRDNAASFGLLTKLGFVPAGEKSAMSRSRGGEVETIDMQVTRAAWGKLRANRR